MAAQDTGEDLGGLDTGPLTDLPKAPRQLRVVTTVVMVLSALAAAVLGWALRSDALFALSERDVLVVAQLSPAQLGAQHQNRYARATVDLAQAPSFGFRRSFEERSYRVAALSGPGEGAWVLYPVPDGAAGPRFTAPRIVAGRLARVSQLGPRYRGLAKRMVALSGRQGVADEWVLVDGEDPQSSSWLLGLEVLLLAFLTFNVASMVRVRRRIRAS